MFVRFPIQSKTRARVPSVECVKQFSCLSVPKGKFCVGNAVDRHDQKRRRGNFTVNLRYMENAKLILSSTLTRSLALCYCPGLNWFATWQMSWLPHVQFGKQSTHFRSSPIAPLTPSLFQQFSERANFPPMSDENAKENRAKLNKRNSTAFDFDNLRIDLENNSSIELEHSPYENDVKTRGGKCIWDGVSWGSKYS